MIKCFNCGNNKNFFECHVGGERHHSWVQEPNGRFVFEGSNYDNVVDTFFKCGICLKDLSYSYREFLRALFEPFDENKHDDFKK